jgi:uncharacterized sulfatase
MTTDDGRTVGKRKGRGVTRRRFLQKSLTIGGALAAGGLGYRMIASARGRQYDPHRTEQLLAAIRPSEDLRELPNIVVISADDLGYGDLGSYGSRAIRTPNLDTMAAEGVRLTRAYASAPLCSPSRASLLTGRYAIRTHINMPLYPAGSMMDIIFNAGGVYSYGIRGIPEDEVLLPELLGRRGYRTALLGKWHLGDRSPHLPTENGFDYFFGAHCSNDMEPYAIFRNRDMVLPPPVDQDMLTQHLTQEAVGFLRQHRDRPFFLYYAQPFPHVPLHASEAFRGRSQAGLYGDTVEEVDWSVGEVLRTLEEEGLESSTLVIMTSDNGPWWEGSAGFRRGRKNLSLEGGHLVPFMARWPGVIPSGLVSDAMSMNFDIFATCLAAAGIPLPNDRIIDGKNLLPVLRGEASLAHDTLYYYKGRRLVGVRQGKWKYLRRHMTDNGGYAGLSQGPFLFDLDLDPNESYSLLASEPEVARTLEQMLDAWEAATDENRRGWL